MRVHIDWLSFTVRPVYGTNGETDISSAVVDGINFLLGNELYTKVLPSDFKKRERSRAPYTVAWESTGAGITIFASAELDHFTVEISGQGCEILHHNGIMNELLTAVHEHVTRIDIACDIETSVTPLVFVTNKTHERMRSSGYQKSETGETCYVGSQKSDRYARVYRYNPPHPRSHLLRVEHVFRRDYAKLVARECATNNLPDIAKAAGEAFGWNNPQWEVGEASHISLSTISGERTANNTVFWLVHSCAPAFRKLVEKGDIRDAEAFLRTYFLSNDE